MVNRELIHVPGYSGEFFFVIFLCVKFINIYYKTRKIHPAFKKITFEFHTEKIAWFYSLNTNRKFLFNKIAKNFSLGRVYNRISFGKIRVLEETTRGDDL